MKTKIHLFLLAVLVVLTLGGCGGVEYRHDNRTDRRDDRQDYRDDRRDDRRYY